MDSAWAEVQHALHAVACTRRGHRQTDWVHTLLASSAYSCWAQLANCSLPGSCSPSRPALDTPVPGFALRLQYQQLSGLGELCLMSLIPWSLALHCTCSYSNCLGWVSCAWSLCSSASGMPASVQQGTVRHVQASLTRLSRLPPSARWRTARWDLSSPGRLIKCWAMSTS